MRMNRLTTPLAVACLFVVASAVAFAQEPATPTSAPAGALQRLYSCPTHPQIRWSRADACPLCGMKLVATKIARPADEVDGDHSSMAPHVHDGMGMPGHAGMSMDHGAMGHDMMGCEMCMQMMSMQTMSMGGMNHSPAPAAQKAAPTAQRGYGKGGRGGRGCGC